MYVVHDLLSGACSARLFALQAVGLEARPSSTIAKSCSMDSNCARAWVAWDWRLLAFRVGSGVAPTRVPGELGAVIDLATRDMLNLRGDCLLEGLSLIGVWLFTI